jgi:4-aminobutyrate aminotransferase
MSSRPEWAKGPRVKGPIPGPRARAIIERDEKVMSPSYTRSEPVVASEGWGCYVKDVDGNVFLDMSSGMFVLNYGYSNPRLIRATREQLEKLTHFAGTDFYYESQVELAERLVRITPGNFSKRVYLANSGAEAVEAALKCVRWHTRRPRVISFLGAFHGRTYGAMSLSSSNVLHHRYFFPLVPGVSFMPYPYCYRCLFKQSYPGCDFLCVEFIREYLKRVIPPEEVAGVIIEPIQGNAGYIIPPPEYLPMLKELCEEHEWVLIADEIQTGLGRSGKMFAVEHWKVVPEITCVAKALSGGIAPIGATIARSKVMDWEPGAHASTFGGNLVACAAAIEGLKLLEEERLVERTRKLGEFSLRYLKEMEEEVPIVGEVRGKGLMLAVEFVRKKENKKDGTKERDLVIQATLKRGAIFFRGGRSSLRIAPPLVIPEEDLEKGLGILREAVEEVAKKC